MEFKNLVESRRSTRAYQKEPITEYEIREIISCAQEAPSWKNSQTARYYVAKSEAVFDEVKQTLPDFNQESIKNCGCLIVTSFVKNRSGFNKEGFADNELGNEWGAYDLGLSNSLLLLRAKELGFDTLIMGLRDAAKLKEILGIPDNEEVVSVIGVGKGEGILTRPKRRDINDILKIY